MEPERSSSIPVTRSDSANESDDIFHESPLVKTSTYLGTLGFRSLSFLRTGTHAAKLVSNAVYRLAVDVSGNMAEKVKHTVSSAEELLIRNVSTTTQLDDDQKLNVSMKVTATAGALKNGVQYIDHGIRWTFGWGHKLSIVLLGYQDSAIQSLDEMLARTLERAGFSNVSAMRRSHSLLEAVQIIVDLLGPLSECSPSELSQAAVALSSLQEASAAPYPCREARRLPLSQRVNERLFNSVSRQFRFCLAAYTPFILRTYCGIPVYHRNREELFEFYTGLPRSSVKVWGKEVDVFRPAFFIAVSDDDKQVMLTIKGSTTVQDILTDICCQIEQGHHSGMLNTAEWMDRRLRHVMIHFANQHPTYKVVLQGHSLGAAVASLLCMRWLSEPALAGPNGDRLHAFAFAPPCVTSPELALICKDHITSVMFARDAISRLSVGSMMNLRRMLLHITHPTTSTQQIREQRNQLLTSMAMTSPESLMYAPAASLRFAQSPAMSRATDRASTAICGDGDAFIGFHPSNPVERTAREWASSSATEWLMRQAQSAEDLQILEGTGVAESSSSSSSPSISSSSTFEDDGKNNIQNEGISSSAKNGKKMEMMTPNSTKSKSIPFATPRFLLGLSSNSAKNADQRFTNNHQNNTNNNNNNNNTPASSLCNANNHHQPSLAELVSQTNNNLNNSFSSLHLAPTAIHSSSTPHHPTANPNRFAHLRAQIVASPYGARSVALNAAAQGNEDDRFVLAQELEADETDLDNLEQVLSEVQQQDETKANTRFNALPATERDRIINQDSNGDNDNDRPLPTTSNVYPNLSAPPAQVGDGDLPPSIPGVSRVQFAAVQDPSPAASPLMNATNPALNSRSKLASITDEDLELLEGMTIDFVLSLSKEHKDAVRRGDVPTATQKKALLARCMRVLRDSSVDSSHILIPAGRTLFFVPGNHLRRAGDMVIDEETPGDCCMFELGEQVLAVASELVLDPQSLPDHLPGYMASALGVEPSDFKANREEHWDEDVPLEQTENVTL